MKHNSVFLYGKIKNINLLSPVSATFEIEVVKGIRHCGNNRAQYKHDIITVITDVDYLVDEIKSWKTDDMVEVKGVLAKEEVSLVSECPYCKAENTKDFTAIFVEPVYLSKIEKANSRKITNDLLTKKREISNQITIGGNLVTPVQKYVDKNGCNGAVYNIRTEENNRYFPDKTSSNVFLVRSYEDMAEQDSKFLKKNSLVLIDGSLQSVKSKKKIVCEKCEKTYSQECFSLEIIPYDCEYASEYTIEE